MFVDISFEYDCAYEEFIYDGVEKFSKSDIWMCFHTDFGKRFLESVIDTDFETIKTNERFLVDNELARKIHNWITVNDFNGKHVSCIWGGFYWEDKNHTKHI